MRDMDDFPDDISEEALKLDNQICFALYVCSKEVIKKYKPLLDKLDLTYTGYITLLALWEEDNIPVNKLGKRMYLDSGTLTPLLKKLESKGLITRERGEDERLVYICLTDAGKQLKEKVVLIPKQIFCSIEMDLDEAGNLLYQLRNLMQSFETK